MHKVRLPGTDLVVSRLAFGSGSVHHVLSRRRREHLLSEARALGFSHFDTAPYYGFGVAESSLGQGFRGAWRDLTVATKIGLYSPFGRTSSSLLVAAQKLAGRMVKNLSRPAVDWAVERAEDSLMHSLRALGRNHVDILFLHEPDLALTQADEFARWLEKKRSEGSLRYWGVAGTIGRCLRWAEQRHPIAQVVQTGDSLERREASALLQLGRELQFTFGYLAAAGRNTPPETTIHRALAANTSGSILVSSRSPTHLRMLAGAVEKAIFP